MRATKIINIKKIGKLRCLDIEVDNNDHLFVANGLICSNSHSISYAANAYYYSLYPKVHFPRSFFVAQLEFMNDLDEVDGFVEDAKYFGVVTKKPDLRNGNVISVLKMTISSLDYHLLRVWAKIQQKH